MVTSSLVVTVIFFCHICLRLVSAANNITTTEFLNDSDTLVSSNGRFMFGFFSPLNSTNRYAGIWYNTEDSDPKEVVWVANRNNPINDSSGVLKLSVDGNLQLSDGKDLIYWSSNVSRQANSSTSVAQLQDTGNLVLFSSSIGMIVWQSFEHLTNSLLPHTSVSIDLSIVRSLYEDVYPILQSWKSASDPSTGHFSLGMVPFRITEFIASYDDQIYWRSGPWDGNQFLGLPDVSAETAVSFHIVYDNHNRTLDMLYSEANETVLRYYTLNDDGNVALKNWDEGSQKWELLWLSFQSDCDIYGKCGPFGSCDSEGSPMCSCLHGFEPKIIDEWMAGNWTSGCVRRTPLQCGITGSKEDRFLELKHMKVPFDPTYESGYNQDACRNSCLESCSCVAYAYPIGIGCMIWETLIDIQGFTSGGADLFVRLAYSELDERQETSNMRIIIPVIASIAGTTFVALGYCLWNWVYRRHVTKTKNNERQFVDAGVDQADFKGLSLFKLKELEVATDNFSETKKLGQGGFGPVCMGILENGVKVAVKRLSRASGQGQQEFMNEVLVISKLQHKNLVRLLGCCVEREEKLLVYEFMPNKSLDALLFDSHHQKQLDWKKRFNIINGICRGLLYLHRDSRLKIIHRDLKASNILLDEELDPKISDFGMARIFGSKQDQANTLRVVGTYGYMSPEYAMEGLFSEKSDVFSLGVLLLEIVSGRKNSSFQNKESLSLLTYAWKLWTENDILSLVDPAIRDPCFTDEFLKCIQLGLLCVQEYPEDRPTISALISMLDFHDIADLPHPTQPGFTHRKASSSDEVLQGHQEHGSVNHVSLTAFSGR